MTSDSNPLERAYELARCGTYADVQNIVRRLRVECFDYVAALRRHRELVADSLDIAAGGVSDKEQADLVNLALQFDSEAVAIAARARLRDYLT